MGRISEKNRRFRNKEEICCDVARVLAAPLSYGTKFAVLADVVWVWSEYHGKLNGCSHWSKAAHKVRSAPKRLTHEHLVPKRVVIEKLFALKPPCVDAVRAVLEKYCIGVVVTREEDARLTELGLRSKMPDGWNGEDAWARYRSAEIALWNNDEPPN